MHSQRTSSSWLAVVFWFPLIVGFFQDLVGFRVYRELGLLDVSAFFLAGAISLRYLHGHPSLIRKPSAIRRIITLWMVLAILLALYYPSFSLTYLSGGYLHYLRVILLVGTAFFIGNYVAVLVDYWSMSRLITLLPLLAFAFSFRFLGQVNLSIEEAVALNHLPGIGELSAGVFERNSISIIVALCLPIVISLFLNGSRVDKLLAIFSFAAIIILVTLATSRLAFTVTISGIIYALLIKQPFVRLGDRLKFFVLAMVFFALIIVIIQARLPGVIDRFQSKMEGYGDNLYSVRYEMITRQQLSYWVQDQTAFWLGDGNSWGHNHLVTAALKGGVGTVVIYLLLHLSMFLFILRGSGPDRNHALLIYLMVFTANSIGDFVFTNPYFTYFSMFLLGWLSLRGHMVLPESSLSKIEPTRISTKTSFIRQVKYPPIIPNSTEELPSLRPRNKFRAKVN